MKRGARPLALPEQIMGLLSDIGTFGDGSAEDDDAVLSYFLKTEAVEQIESGKRFVVIGRKGSGKTALVKYFSQSHGKYISESPSLRVTLGIFTPRAGIWAHRISRAT